MSHDFVQKRVRVYPEVGAAITTDLVDFGGSTGVVAVMNFATPIEVLRMGITVDDNELLDVGVGFSIKLWKYLVPGSSTNAVALGTITSTTDVAKGSSLYNNLAAAVAQASGDDTLDGGTTPQTSLVDVSPRNANSTNNYIVNTGQQLVWDLTDAADTSGKGQVWVEYVERPMAGTAFANATEVTA